MTNRRILGFSFVAAAIVAFLVLRQFTIWVIGMASLSNWAFGPFTAADVVGLTVTLGLAIGMWRYPKVNGFLSEVVDETSKVVWPSRQETRDSTIVVIVFVFVVAAILGGFDFLWAKVTNLILSGPAN